MDCLVLRVALPLSIDLDEYLRLLEALPSYLKFMVTFGYKTGWRKGETLNLAWNRADLGQGVVRLKAGETRNQGARNLHLDSGLQEMFKGLWETLKPGCRFVFDRYKVARPEDMKLADKKQEE